MANIVVERVFDGPLDISEAERIRNMNRWCVELYGIRHVRSYLSSDRRRMICLTEAVDAESVRVAARDKDVAVDRVWPAAFHAPDGGTPPENVAPHADLADEERGLELVIVERAFPEPVAFEDIQAIEDRGAWCLEAHNVRFLYTYFSFDRRRMICMYEAPDAESVRQAQRAAEMPFDRVWTASVLGSSA